MGKKWAVIAVLIVFLIFLTIQVMDLTGWGSAVLFPVTKVVREVLAPVQNSITAVTERANGLLDYLRDNKASHLENEELKKRIALLEKDIYKLKEQELENQRLRELLSYQEDKADHYELLLAKVVSREPNSWYKSITVNRGSTQGVEPDMPVVTDDGLVGIIIGVTKNTAEVLLLLDAEGAVGARILENRLAPGVVTGTGRSDYLQMIHLPHDIPIESGHTVVTSGLGGLYPKGIRIGKVAEVSMEAGGLIKNALIEPFVDFDRLEEVFIILTVKEPEADYLPEPDILLTDSGVTGP